MLERECDGGFMSTSLQKAARAGDANLVAYALECTQTNLDAPDAEGCTALMIAAGLGHLNVVRALADAGADLAAIDASGRTAAQIASAAGHADIHELLARAQAERDALLAALTAGSMASNEVGGTSFRGKGDDLMAKLTRQAGLPAGPSEAPF